MNGQPSVTGRSDVTTDVSSDQLTILREAMERARREALALSETTLFTANHVLALDIAGYGLLRIQVTVPMVLGRTDADSTYRPDVDLTTFGAQRMGISRRHAQLSHVNNCLQLADLGSRNGTLVNNRRLEPNTPLNLHSNDELVLGTLRLRIRFMRA